MRCPYCGHEIPEKRRFCGACGYKLDQEPGKPAPDFLDEDAPTRLEDVHPVDEDAHTRLEDVPSQGIHSTAASRQAPSKAPAPPYSKNPPAVHAARPVQAAMPKQPSSKPRRFKLGGLILTGLVVFAGLGVVGAALLFLKFADLFQASTPSLIPEMENFPTTEPIPSATGAPATETPFPDTVPLVLSDCDLGTFLMDVTVPDDSEITTYTAFLKTWRIRNNGSCTWTPDYKLVFWDGNSLGSANQEYLLGEIVAPGEIIELSIELISPAEVGSYRSEWVLMNSSGEFFGMHTYEDLMPLYVEISVTESYSTPTPEIMSTESFGTATTGP